jgi:hypothetical protein
MPPSTSSRPKSGDARPSGHPRTSATPRGSQARAVIEALSWTVSLAPVLTFAIEPSSRTLATAPERSYAPVRQRRGQQREQECGPAQACGGVGRVAGGCAALSGGRPRAGAASRGDTSLPRDLLPLACHVRSCGGGSNAIPSFTSAEVQHP